MIMLGHHDAWNYGWGFFIIAIEEAVARPGKKQKPSGLRQYPKVKRHPRAK